MQKTVLLTLVLFVLAAWAVAQQAQNPQAPSTSSPSHESAPQASAEETAIEGCLGGAAGNYTVTDKSGMVYKLQLQDDSKNAVLDKHIGQEVRMNGTVVKADSAAASGAGESKEAAGASKSQATIRPTSLEKIADTCSAKTEKPEKK